MQCLLDMDGVLVDFAGAVEKRFGITIHQWDFDSHLPISKTEFWDSCDRAFWASLDWTPEGWSILKLAEAHFGKENVCLLTSPCEADGCLEGKRDWIRKHAPEYRRRYFMGPAKGFATRHSRVLIDDSHENVIDFWAGGGPAVLVPRPWNPLRGIPVVEHIHKCLETYVFNGRAHQ